MPSRSTASRKRASILRIAEKLLRNRAVARERVLELAFIPHEIRRRAKRNRAAASR